MNAPNVISFGVGHNRLDYLKREIRSGHELVVKGGQDWIEGSLQIARALREARDAHPADISFSGWLKQNDCAVFNADDRAALINLAADEILMREVLSKSDSHSYKYIWREHAARYRQIAKPARSPTGRKTRSHMPGRKQLHLAMKLGAETVERIKGTTLDRSDEKEALLRLNRGIPLGELSDVVRQLVDDAAAGKDVSAIAYMRNLNKPVNPPNVTTFAIPRARELLPAWRKRMTSPWLIASFNERVELFDYLISTLTDKEHEYVVEHIVDNLPPANKPTGGHDGE